MDRFSLVYAYYDNKEMLNKQFEVWEQWPKQVKGRVQIVIVDDCSPTHQAVDQYRDVGVPVRIWRVLKNIPWNQNGARNLAVATAPKGWCLLTDMDHVLTSSMAELLLSRDPDPTEVFSFARRHPGKLDEDFKPHPNSWFLTKDMYWTIGGMDEDFAGWYGSDSTFRKAIMLETTITFWEDIYLVVYDENDIPDANTREFGRKLSEYHSPNNPQLAKKRKHPGYKAENPIRFPYARVL